MREPLRVLALVACLALAGAAAAHALRLFAAVEGADLTGLAFFADGGRARDVPVALRVDGVVVAEVRTDAEGRFRFAAPEPTAARVEAATADGHRATWDVPASAWVRATSASGNAASATPAGAAPARAAAGDAPAATGAPAAVAAGDGPPTAPDPTLEARIEAAVARQVDRLREDLALAESRRRLSDVVGGVGYLLGLTGLASLLLRRKQG